MFSKKFLTTLLVIVVLILSYQTYALASLSTELETAKIGIGGSSAVNLVDDGDTPDMVGGC